MEKREKEKEEKKEEWESAVLDLTRVSRMTAGGRRFKIRAIVVVGNRRGKVGVASGKGIDVAEAVEKAERKAKKKAIEVPILGATIPYEVEAKFCSAKVILKPQRKGRGLVAGGVVRVICDLCGISDICSKLISKTRNKYNIAKATILALEKLKT